MLPPVIRKPQLEKCPGLKKQKDIEFWLEHSLGTYLPTPGTKSPSEPKSKTVTGTVSVLDNTTDVGERNRGALSDPDLESDYFSTDLDSDEVSRLSLSRLSVSRLPMSRLSIYRLFMFRLSMFRLSMFRLSMSRLSISRLSMSRLFMSRLSMSRLFMSQHQTEPDTDKPRELISVITYRKACDRFGILPVRRILSKLGKQVVCLKDMALTMKDIKAVCTALLFDVITTCLSLSGTNMSTKSCRHVTELLDSSQRFSELDISNNYLGSEGVKIISDYVRHDRLLLQLNLSGNKIHDRDTALIANIIQENTTLRSLLLSNNHFRETCGRSLGTAIAKNTSLKELDLSWNHIRRLGAIEISRGLEKNKGLETVDLSWNGFSFEGCVALSDALQKNRTLLHLDLTCNRIHPPGLLELTKGLCQNKILKTLKLGHNPITAVFTTVLLEEIRNSPEMSLEELNLEGVVVDKEFEDILTEINTSRMLFVTFEASLPLTKESQQKMLSEAVMPSVYNVDPLRMLYLLKEKNRAQDFFRKINKDQNDYLTPDELHKLFKESGIPVTGSVVSRIMDFMDKNKDGGIDLAEFLEGDKKMRKITREQARQAQASLEDDSYNKYSRSFRKAYVDPVTFRLKVDEAPNLSPVPGVSPAGSRRPSFMDPTTNVRRLSLRETPNSRRNSLALFDEKRRLSLR
ncbi:hypothetical protein ScPMuIL_011175 [Solemya velum]